jgi:hypothetical protein
MITLSSDKLALIRTWFSMKDLVHQGPERSTPEQVIYPGAFTPLRKAA